MCRMHQRQKLNPGTIWEYAVLLLSFLFVVHLSQESDSKTTCLIKHTEDKRILQAVAQSKRSWWRRFELNLKDRVSHIWVFSERVVILWEVDARTGEMLEEGLLLIFCSQLSAEKVPEKCQASCLSTSWATECKRLQTNKTVVKKNESGVLL